MKKAWALLLALALGFGGILYAQEEGGGGESPIESDWEIYAPELYSKGDQIFIMSAGLDYLMAFYNQGEKIDHNFASPPIGGTGSLSYNYFLDSHLSAGVEIGGMFNSTAVKNTLFIIPIGLRLGYQFVYRRFEIPITGGAGIAPQKYVDANYFGFFVKAGAGVFYRWSPDWSFGVQADWVMFPQTIKETEKTVYAHFMNFTLAFRYHF